MAVQQAKLVISAEDRASAALGRIGKAFEQVEKSARAAGQIDRMSRAFEDLRRQGAAIDKTRASINRLRQAEERLGSAHGDLERLSKIMAATESPTRKMVSAFERAQRAVQRAGQEFRDQAVAVAAARREMEALGVAASKMEAAERRIEQTLARSTRRMRERDAFTAESIAMRERAVRPQPGAAGILSSTAVGSLAGGARGHDAADAVAGLGVGHMAKRTFERATEGWAEMDEAIRRQRAILGFTEEQQAGMKRQAIQIGQDTRFTNPDVVRAQTRIGATLPDNLKQPGVIQAATKHAADYALAMGTTMDEAAEAIIGRVKGLQYDISTPEAADRSAKHAANRMVQLAKMSGAEHHDLMGYGKFGYAPGHTMGFSEEFQDAMAAQLKRLGYEGAMAGTFTRAAATKLAVPTQKGRAVLAQAGINHDDHADLGKRMSPETLDSVVKYRFGKSLNASQLKRIKALMEDEDIVGSREEFVPKVSTILEETFAGKNKKGKTKAQDAAKIAKMVDEYLTGTIESVRVEDLMREVLKKGITPALAKYLFGTEHGGRVMGLRLDQLEKDVISMRKTPDNRAAQIGEDINKGFAGEKRKLQGSIETFFTRLGEVFDQPLRLTYRTLSDTVDGLTNLDGKVLAAGTSIVGLTAAAVMAKGALAALGLIGVPGAAAGSAILGGLLGGVARMIPWAAAAGAGTYVGSKVGEGINEVGAVAAGKYWTPKDAEELNDLRDQRKSASDQIEGIRARTHPAMRDQFNPEVDRLERSISTLDGRIRSFEEQHAGSALQEGDDRENRVARVRTPSLNAPAAPAPAGAGYPPLPPPRPQASDMAAPKVVPLPPPRPEVGEPQREPVSPQPVEPRAEVAPPALPGAPSAAPPSGPAAPGPRRDASSLRLPPSRPEIADTAPPGTMRPVDAAYDSLEMRRARARLSPPAASAERRQIPDLAPGKGAEVRGGQGAIADLQGAIRVETGEVDEAHQKVSSLSESVTGLEKTVAPRIDSSSIDSATSKARDLMRVLQQLAGIADGAASAISGVGRTSYADT